MVGTEDYPLVKQAQERLVEVHQSRIPHRFDEKAGVQQVEHGVLCPAGVLVNGQPLPKQLRVERAVGILGTNVTKQVPGRVKEGVHCVGFPPGRTGAAGAGDVAELLIFGQGGFAGGLKLGILRQQHRQRRFRNRNYAAAAAVNHRNRSSPVSLTGN